LSLFRSLDLVVLERQSDGHFCWMTPPTRWARQLICESDSESESLDVATAMPFVDFFLEDAVDHWKSGSTEALFSGEFVELLPSGEQLALQARALVHESSHVLILEKLGERFDKFIEAHQVARNSMLTRDQMGIEIDRITQRIREREEHV